MNCPNCGSGWYSVGEWTEISRKPANKSYRSFECVSEREETCVPCGDVRVKQETRIEVSFSGGLDL